MAKRTRKTRAKKVEKKFLALYSGCGDASQLEVIENSVGDRLFATEADAKEALNEYMSDNGMDGGTAAVAQAVDFGKSGDFTWGRKSIEG